jgi:dienelactone hydrolase
LSESITIESDDIRLLGEYYHPINAKGIILFSHGSGSGRHSPRNNWVAKKFNEAGFATLLVDLLTEKEAERDAITMEHRFDVALLASRMLIAARWLKGRHTLKIGYYGSSTGASAALIAAAEKPELVAAIVSRGGRADLAGKSLPKVRAPTLLIVGGLDTEVLQLNREAQRMMRVPTRLEIIEGATHLFEEPGKLEEVAKLSIDWFRSYVK